MPQGTGVATLQSIPTQPFVIDPQSFFQMTSRNIATPKQFAAPGGGLFQQTQLPQTGVIGKLLITFVGSVVVAGGAATTTNQWPYNLIKGFKLSANGQNDLWSCNGIDLDVLRFIRYPSYAEHVDTFPGSVGINNSVANGTYNLGLTWEVPIAMDDTSLVGALYAQSSATNLTTTVTQALNTDLFLTIPGTVAITGTFYIEEIFYEIPFDKSGNLIIPDLTRLHGFNALDTAFTNVGDVRTPLIRGAGQLSRLFVAYNSAPDVRLSAQPSAASTARLDKLAINYGINQTPYSWNPAQLLLSVNNQHYGAPAPYDRLVVDLVRENPVRDAIFMQGLTELAVVGTVNAAVVVSAGNTHVVQETLF